MPPLGVIVGVGIVPPLFWELDAKGVVVVFDDEAEFNVPVV